MKTNNEKTETAITGQVLNKISENCRIAIVQEYGPWLITQNTYADGHLKIVMKRSRSARKKPKSLKDPTTTIQNSSYKTI